MGRGGHSQHNAASSQERREPTRDERLAAAFERLGIAGDDYLLYPIWTHLRRGSTPELGYYELFLGPHHTAWGDLDREHSEIHHVSPDKLERILSLLADGAGLDGLRRGFALYEAGHQDGYDDGYNEGYRDGESPPDY